MARDADIDRLLREWAQWLMVGDGSGFPVRSTLHPEWSPPSPGTTPTLKASPPSTARRTHKAVCLLSDRLQTTLWLHYCTGLSVADQAVRLQCQPDTVGKRIQDAHRQLMGVLRNTDAPYSSGTLQQG